LEQSDEPQIPGRAGQVVHLPPDRAVEPGACARTVSGRAIRSE
jgi:hypothetical protein